MVFCATVAFCFPMKVSIFDVHPYRQPNIGIVRELLAGRLLGAGTAEMKNGGVAVFEHVNGHLNLDSSPIASVCDELPNCRRTCCKGGETDKIERRNETAGVDPDANSLGKYMAINRQSRMQVGAKNTIVFRAH